MKKQTLVTLIIIFAAVIVIAIFFNDILTVLGAEESITGKKEQESSETVLGQSIYIDSDQVYKIHMKYDDVDLVLEKETVVEKEMIEETEESPTESSEESAEDESSAPKYKEVEKQVWFITEPRRFPTDENTVSSFLKVFEGLQTMYSPQQRDEITVPESYKDESLDEFLGLTKPHLSITLYTTSVFKPEREFTLTAGTPKRVTPTLANLYVTDFSSDEQRVYFMERSKVDGYKKTIKELRRKDIIVEKENQVDKVVVDNGIQTFTKVGETWILSGYSEAECETNKIKSTVNAILGIRAAEFYDDVTNFAEYNLGTPLHTADIYRGSEKLHTIYFNRKTIPPEDEEGKETQAGFARLEGDSTVYKMSGMGVLDTMEKPTDYYIKEPEPETDEITSPEDLDTSLPEPGQVDAEPAPDDEITPDASQEEPVEPASDNSADSSTDTDDVIDDGGN
jgi:hypothetical protein